MFSRLSRGIGRQRGQTFSSQSQTHTYSNTLNLNHSNNDPSNNVLVCSNPRKNWGLTNQSNVPGPVRKLTNVPGMPLYNYKQQRTYLAGGTKWPQYGLRAYPSTRPLHIHSSISTTIITPVVTPPSSNTNITATAINGYVSNGIYTLYDATNTNNYVLLETGITNERGNINFTTIGESLPDVVKINISSGTNISTQQSITTQLSSIHSKQSILETQHVNNTMLSTLCTQLIETSDSQHSHTTITEHKLKLSTVFNLSSTDKLILILLLNMMMKFPSSIIVYYQ